MKAATLTILVIGFVGASFFWLFLNIGHILSTEDRAVPGDAILFLSGSPTRAEKAMELFRDGFAKTIVVTTLDSYREIVALGGVPARIVVGAWSASTTFEEGRLALDILSGSGFRHVIVVTDPYHICRARWTFSHFFTDSNIEFSFVSSEAEHLQGFWWSNPASRFFVLSELPKIAYYWLWYGVFGIEKDPKLVRAIEKKYRALIKV